MGCVRLFAQRLMLPDELQKKVDEYNKNHRAHKTIVKHGLQLKPAPTEEMWATPVENDPSKPNELERNDDPIVCNLIQQRTSFN